MKQAELLAGQLAVTVTAEGKFGWCGLSRLAHAAYPNQWLLSPAFTLEHYIGIPQDAAEYVEYEPCYSAKMLEKIAADKCTLRYKPLPCSQIDFSATYQVIAPHYIDVTLKMKTGRNNWPLNHLALFFATIVDAPVYTGVNLLGRDVVLEALPNDRWIHFNSLAGQQGKTAHPADVINPELPRPQHAPNTYYYSDSSIRFAQPFFYTTIDSMMFALFFRSEDKERVRFTVNPLAPAFGGPAWDFIWNVPAP